MERQKRSRPLFITFEGGEGAGKTTLIKRLVEHLPAAVQTREPGGTLLSEKVRALLLDCKEVSIAPKAELLLFLAARAQHIQELIVPALKQGKTVLCDRFNDSSIVYQGIARGLGQDFVKKLCELACGEPVPDITFYLDVPPEVGLARAKGRDETADRIGAETLEFHNRVREGFLQLAEQELRIRVIDATLSVDEVYQQIVRELP